MTRKVLLSILFKVLLITYWDHKPRRPFTAAFTKFHLYPFDFFLVYLINIPYMYQLNRHASVFSLSNSFWSNKTYVF